MSARDTPIKFGPEWLRNLARERSAGGSTSASNSPSGAGAAGGGGGMAAHSTLFSPTGSSPKVLLAKQRYGREEMLALYDRNVEAPAELTNNETLYQPRGTPPIALYNTFDEDSREPARSGPPPGATASVGERFGRGRGTVGLNVAVEGRGRGRLAFLRQPSVPRAMWHGSSPRMPGYSTGPDDDPNAALRSWNNNNAPAANTRNPGDQADWQNQKQTFRAKRPSPGATTNWRQAREEDEWRASDSARPRSMQPDKWERDWGDRPNTDKGQSSPWSSNRRPWVGGDEENLPEWAMDNAEACGGTFDSSGAFHGYSNDDSNVPKQEAPFTLARSHTHGNLVRSKTAEEGSDEWWASEKAKKLSPKRFDKYDALEIKFKTTTAPDDSGASSTANKPFKEAGIEEQPTKVPRSKHNVATTAQDQAKSATSPEEACKKKSVRFTESKTFDALMRQEINRDESTDDRGNIQSVMINKTNSLRQKHQNITGQPVPATQSQSRDAYIKLIKMQRKATKSEKQQEDKIVNDIIDMNLEDKEIKDMLSTLPSPSDNMSSSSGMSSIVTSRSQHRLPSPDTITPMIVSKGTMTAPKSSHQSHSQPVGHANSALNASLGLSMGPPNDAVKRHLGMPLQGVPAPVMPSQNMTGMQKSQEPNMATQNMGMASHNLSTSLSSQNIAQSLSGKNMGPKLSGQNIGPNLTGQGVSGQNMGQVMSGQNMSSGMSGQNMSSGMSGQTMGSGMSGQNMSLGMSGLNMGSGMSGQNMGPNLSGQGIGPNMSNQGIGPNMTQNMGSNMSGQNMASNMTGQSMGQNLSGQNMGQNLSGQSMGPNMSAQSTASQLPGQNMGTNQTMAGMMPGNSGMSAFPPIGSANAIKMANAFLQSSMLFGRTPNNQNQPTGDIPMPGRSSNMFPMHGLQHSSSQPTFGSSIYGSMIPPPPPPTSGLTSKNQEMWYYEDPKKVVQGPFLSRDMAYWYRAGFFTPSLMVRRANDTVMRPLGSYGPVAPFMLDLPLTSYPGFEGTPGARDPLLTPQPGMNLESMNMPNMNVEDTNPINLINPIESIQFAGLRNPPFGQQPIDSLWSQPPPQPPQQDMIWWQQAAALKQHNDNLSAFFWAQQPSSLEPNLLRSKIPKEMKTEDEILAQMRASQANTSQSLSFLNNPPLVTSTSNLADPPEEPFQQSNLNIVPDLDKLQKLMLEKPPVFAPIIAQNNEPKVQQNEKDLKPTDFNLKNQQPVQKQEQVESKDSKNVEPEKAKETTPSKSKGSKKTKDNASESKSVVDATKTNSGNRSTDASPAKSKKEDKLNKKEAEKERKEWINEGFTIVKAQDKALSKENKKKQEELKIAEELERKRKEEERLVAEEEKKMKNLENLKKESQKRQQQAESLSRKAPWSAVANQTAQEATKDGPTLAEIQRLEREKKLMQMKEQQQMMHIIAQQQAASLAREQEMQAGLGWNKKQANMNVNTTGPSLAEIQAEARKQAAAAAVEAAAVAARAQAEAPTVQAPTLQAPWVNSMNGAPGFWESLGPVEPPAQAAPEPKPKKKVQINPPKKEQAQAARKEQAPPPTKKEPSPSEDFQAWCMTVLTSWNTKIDVPTFVGFLKDIESPYEVKDYVKCYLGETRDASDFARQFLERRSKLLRVGMVTPSDDLCSPAVAINPRTSSGSDYQEVKGKGKKSKKNKMLKVDACILGFSVTAAEDRINVGDIDMA